MRFRIVDTNIDHAAALKKVICTWWDLQKSACHVSVLI